MREINMVLKHQCLFLLLHKEGRYALTHAEKWTAVSFITCVVIGIGVMCMSFFLNDKELSANYTAAGLVVLTLCIPAGHMRYPLALRKNSFSQWIEIGLIALAIITVIITIAGVPPMAAVIVYFILFVVYTWSKAF